MTGAARSTFLVNTPAVAQLVALTSSATSGAPSALKPACAAAAAKPRGEVTEPSGISTRAAGIGAQDSPPPSLVKPSAVSYHSTTFPGGPFDVGTVPELRRLRRTRASTLQRRTIRRSDRDPARRPGALSARRRVTRRDGVRAPRARRIPLGPPLLRGGGGSRPGA